MGLNDPKPLPFMVMDMETGGGSFDDIPIDDNSPVNLLEGWGINK
jgi:hypothetical protein